MTASAEALMDRLLLENPYTGFPVGSVEPDLQGWHSGHPVFRAVLEVLRPAVVVEVGTWKGGSAIHMATEAKALKLNTGIICVDTWLGSPEHIRNPKRNRWMPSLKLQNGYPTIYRTFLANVIEKGCTDIIIPFPATSDNAAVVLKQSKVRAKLVYIDAAHEYEPVMRDLTHYWEDILEPGGLLIGDDYGAGWAGVTQAANEFAAQRGIELLEVKGKYVLAKGEMPQRLRELQTELKEKDAAREARRARAPAGALAG